MGVSISGSTGRLLLPVVAAVLLAGLSTDAAAYGSKGKIFFETAKTLPGFSFTYLGPTATDETDRQGFSFNPNGCKIVEEPGLVALQPIGGRGSLGYVSSSLGIYDGPQGTDCGRVSADKGEAIELALDQLPTGAGNAFDRLDLDIEAKGDVVLRLEITFDNGDTNRTETYYLTAGAGVVDDPAVPAERITECSPASDAGPDSADADNCRWQVDELGTKFRITAVSGEFSLEGGADYAEVEANRTVIFLTEADGIYDCGDTVTSADTAMSCSVTRLDPNDGIACTPVPYVFRTSGGTCTLTVDPQGQQMVANLLVAYQPEDATGSTLDLNDWPASPLSLVKFDTSTEIFTIPACRGFTLAEDDDGVFPGVIPETVPDWVSGGFREFACAFQRTEVFRTNGDTGFLETWIEEGIQFWGDISFSRTGPAD